MKHSIRFSAKWHWVTIRVRPPEVRIDAGPLQVIVYAPRFSSWWVEFKRVIMKFAGAVMLAVLTVLLSGCYPFTSDVWRYEDKEAGVVCWVYSSWSKGGIDCMPIGDTKLQR